MRKYETMNEINLQITIIITFEKLAAILIFLNVENLTK
jgi:hypothetical protein